ncbi:PepSY domain-containing protein [Microbacterium sp. NPDC008134]|uniref:PepSY domain-containing protein n=1 Tax=Microbacterium sp. NPDC008134 TaxID=3364183 RepID=UPI0036E39B54
MNDKTPNPDQTPESTPDAPTVPVTPATDASAHAATAPQPEASAPATATAAPASAPKGRKRALLIGGGAVAAVLLAGGGVAVGAAIADELGDDDDRPGVSDGPRHDEDDDRGGDRDQDGRGDRDDDAPQQGGGPVTGIGTASADEIVEIADAARSAADGEVTSIDAKRDGTWEVKLETAAGDETEVRVDADLNATVVGTDTADGDDTGPTLTLDEATIRSLVAAALDEAEGLITDLDVDDDASRPYDVSVLTNDNRSIDIDLDSSFAVVGTDLDD